MVLICIDFSNRCVIVCSTQLIGVLIMKAKLIVIAGIVALPFSMAFADVTNSAPSATGNGVNSNTPTPTQPAGANTSTGAPMNDKSTLHDSRDKTPRVEHKGTHKTPNDVPVKQTPNDVPIKHQSDFNTKTTNTVNDPS